MQALDVIPLLKSTMPLERAQMRIRTVMSGKDTRKLRDKISKLATSVESEDWDGGQLSMVCMQYSSTGHLAPQTSGHQNSEGKKSRHLSQVNWKAESFL